MSPELNQMHQQFLYQFNEQVDSYWAILNSSPPKYFLLSESMKYSLGSGGKRFRPFLAFLVSESFKLKLNSKIENSILPFCLAIEMIHTYSLIHDDLPSMDNDDFRRGLPTNHKIYGEDIALLAGDALLTHAFHVISYYYKSQPHLGIKLVELLSDKSGYHGMIGGQLLDMKATSDIQLDTIETMHRLKTGALIQASAIGASVVSGCNENQIHLISLFSHALGLAFQIKDDLLDANDKDQDFKSYVKLVGYQQTENYLKQQTDLANNLLDQLSQMKLLDTERDFLKTDFFYLREMLIYNQKRHV